MIPCLVVGCNTTLSLAVRLQGLGFFVFFTKKIVWPVFLVAISRKFCIIMTKKDVDKIFVFI